MILNQLLFKIINDDYCLSRNEIAYLLSLNGADELDTLFSTALKVKKQFYGNNVYIRCLIELSNVCIKNCLYCGIRKDNKSIERFTLPFDEVVKEVELAYELGYLSVVIQAGERRDRDFLDLVSKLLRVIKNIDSKIKVTLSLGEQDYDVYRQWYDDGADRYLLRIESSNRELYHSIHPTDHSYFKRLESIYYLKAIGYQVGTGVLIGIPGQTYLDLADDIIFFKDLDVDMIGMGPYIPHKDTPMGNNIRNLDEGKIMADSLKMIAVTRLLLKDINIASTTALETLDIGRGLERGILAGGNVFMVNFNDYRYKRSYLLYNGKPCSNIDINKLQKEFDSRFSAISHDITYKDAGDSLHAKRRLNL